MDLVCAAPIHRRVSFLPLFLSMKKNVDLNTRTTPPVQFFEYFPLFPLNLPQFPHTNAITVVLPTRFLMPCNHPGRLNVGVIRPVNHGYVTLLKFRMLNTHQSLQEYHVIFTFQINRVLSAVPQCLVQERVGQHIETLNQRRLQLQGRVDGKLFRSRDLGLFTMPKEF